jgi:hypothetical protein
VTRLDWRQRPSHCEEVDTRQNRRTADAFDDPLLFTNRFLCFFVSLDSLSPTGETPIAVLPRPSGQLGGPSICRGSMSWKYVVEVCRGSMSWMYVVDVCRGCMSWKYVVDACRGGVSWMHVVDACRGFMSWMHVDCLGGLPAGSSVTSLFSWALVAISAISPHLSLHCIIPMSSS